ncbi:alpha/beta fold hydrolase [Streptacidiphilus rugosus]|uniref:alpha/beta fold hydrolase n=1 Tax=Streptacidiphilus rugosus TaxID=405783 RepID=UPI0007C6D167|nr:alpha/beta fold hydrolase [Streptacidiphilus rugosus]
MIIGAREHRVVTDDGVELAVVEAGDPTRPTLCFLHGYPDTREVWTPVMAALAATYHVVAYDTRGAGRSSAPEPGRAGYRLDRLEEDFLTVLDALAPYGPVHLVGHDWGSVQGWEFATSPRLQGGLASFTSVSGPAWTTPRSGPGPGCGGPPPRTCGRCSPRACGPGTSPRSSCRACRRPCGAGRPDAAGARSGEPWRGPGWPAIPRRR